MGKNKRNFSRFLEFEHKKIKKHWFWYTIILFFPTLWFSIILPYWGINFLLIEPTDNRLTIWGLITTILLSSIVIFITFTHNLYMNRIENDIIDKKEGEIQYLSTVMENIDKICSEKLSVLKRKIADDKMRADIISNPNNQLKRIITGINECLVKLLNNRENNFKFKDFSVTIIYSFPQEDKVWRWLEGMGEKEMELKTLLSSDSTSTFNYLLKTNKPYYFNNNKEKAKADGQYEYSPQDTVSSDLNEVVGSIFCYRYKIIESEKTYIDAIISISTQRKRFSKDESEICRNVRDNMISLVKDTFGKRIGIELTLLYLQYLKSLEKNDNIEI